MVLASHSDGLIRGLCNKGIVLEGGRLIYADDIQSSLKFYHEHLARLRKQAELGVAGVELPTGMGKTIFGCVESLVLEMGVLHLRGWLASTEGPMPQHLAIEVQGARFPVRRMERYNRPDVVKHLGLVEDRCGFNASFVVPKLKSLEGLHGGLEVLGGMDGGSTDFPLRLAPAVLGAIERG
jgi:hypothetical protein